MFIEVVNAYEAEKGKTGLLNVDFIISIAPIEDRTGIARSAGCSIQIFVGASEENPTGTMQFDVFDSYEDIKEKISPTKH